EASNGAEFVSAVNEITGSPVQLLTGREEAQYAAFGIHAGFYAPEGIAGDLGGGSTELIAINGGEENGTTTPLGSLRLQQLSSGDLAAARKIAEKTIQATNVQWPGKSRRFYAIGGTWRSLARLFIMETGHPLEVTHGYVADAKKYLTFCNQVAEGDLDKFEYIDNISKNRRGLLPYGAIVMAELIDHLQVDSIATSAVGLREGYLYSLLDEETRSRDALLEATSELSLMRARSPRHSRELGRWTDKAFKLITPQETQKQRRWRLAACNLADIAWRSASDYRAEQTLGIINNAGFNSISHEGRAYLALVTFHRYQGLGPKKEPPSLTSLASEEDSKLARMLAAWFRVLYLFSAAEEGILKTIELTREAGGLVLMVPKDLAHLVGEKTEQRIDHLSRELGEPVKISVA
ncbi:MAG: exopolyphosphatase, partial [Pseudomonadota bacterium]